MMIASSSANDCGVHPVQRPQCTTAFSCPLESPCAIKILNSSSSFFLLLLYVSGVDLPHTGPQAGTDLQRCGAVQLRSRGARLHEIPFQDASATGRPLAFLSATLSSSRYPLCTFESHAFDDLSATRAVVVCVCVPAWIVHAGAGVMVRVCVQNRHAGCGCYHGGQAKLTSCNLDNNPDAGLHVVGPVSIDGVWRR